MFIVKRFLKPQAGVLLLFLGLAIALALPGLGAYSAAKLAAPAAPQAAFTPGDLVIYRVGTGTGSLVNTGNPVFLDEYTLAGTLVQSIPLPTAASGSQEALISSGTATSEGLLSRSADGQYIVLTGYGATPGSAGNLGNTSAATVHRVIGRVSATGAIDTSTGLTDFADANNPRSAASTNGTDLWGAGGASGLRYAPLGAITSTQVSTNSTNIRQANIFGGQLYISTGSGTTIRIGMVGTGTPTTPGQTITNLPGIPLTGSPYAFYFADLDAGVPGFDTLYIADDGVGAIQKYSLVGGTWTARGTITASAVRGLTGVTVGTTVSLYGTTGGSGATGGGTLYSFIDTTGYNNTVSGTAASIATAATNTAFRGIALAPVSSVATATPTSGATSTTTSTSTATDTSTSTATDTATTVPTSTATATVTNTGTPVNTSTSTGTATPTSTDTPIPCSYVVTTTNDNGVGTLRQAILCANSNPGTETITFNIPGSGGHIISPLSPLPEITGPVIIDGYSQPGSSPNTNLEYRDRWQCFDEWQHQQLWTALRRWQQHCAGSRSKRLPR